MKSQSTSPLVVPKRRLLSEGLGERKKMYVYPPYEVMGERFIRQLAERGKNESEISRTESANVARSIHRTK